MVLGAHFTIWFSVSFCKKKKKRKKRHNSQVTFTDLLTDLDQLLVNWRLNPYNNKKMFHVVQEFKQGANTGPYDFLSLYHYQLFKPTKDDTFPLINVKTDAQKKKKISTDFTDITITAGLKINLFLYIIRKPRNRKATKLTFTFEQLKHP